MSTGDLSRFSMLELFRLEVESQAAVLVAGLLALERDPTQAEPLEACMRAAHSLKGAARLVGLAAGVEITHAMEDCLVAAQKGTARLSPATMDVLLQGVDLLTRVAQTPEADMARWRTDQAPEAMAFLAALAATLAGALPEAADGTPPYPAIAQAVETDPAGAAANAALAGAPEGEAKAAEASGQERFLRVTADNLNRLLGLAGASMVESGRLKSFSQALLRLKKLHLESGAACDELRKALLAQAPDSTASAALLELQQKLMASQRFLLQRLGELERFDRRTTDLAHRLYDEALACRMRPFSDGVQAFPRMVRDLGRSLGKQVHLDIAGAATRVDRDILERLEAPLGHLLRNAVDHGIESAEARRLAGKPAEGVIRLEAGHAGGMLQIQVIDDGVGIDTEKVRATVVARQLTSAATAADMSEAELLEFLFLPGFTLRDIVTRISGRGVGLDVVQEMVRRIRGSVRVFSRQGEGTRFLLQLPLTLSVLRTLLVSVDGEPYALPLAAIARTLKLPLDRIDSLEGRQHFELAGRRVGLVSARQVLAGAAGAPPGDVLPVVVVGEGAHAYGLIVDAFMGERELVVLPLDARLGKVKDIAAGALMEDGAPVLIFDMDDLLRSVEKLAAQGALSQVRPGAAATAAGKRRRVLVVDDSLTVRELERKLLDAQGYEVEVATDGMDGWNAVRAGRFDLVVTDVDMPRLDGIELVSRIRQDPNLRDLPVMIVSYKDREEDRQRGLQAGADYYLAKASFHDEALLQAVVDLIGEAAS